MKWINEGWGGAKNEITNGGINDDMMRKQATKQTNKEQQTNNEWKYQRKNPQQ
jgi:hypothetical protein